VKFRDEEKRYIEQLDRLGQMHSSAKCDCPLCHKTFQFELGWDDYDAYKLGSWNQHVPHSIREVMISGMCPECQDKTFETKVKQ
jgi:C4-type Zn-finger protein